MYLGQIVELGRRQAIFAAPAHPYTQALLQSVPSRAKGRKSFFTIEGDVPSPANPPPGCRFHTRCPLVFDRCRVEAPALRPATAAGHDAPTNAVAAGCGVGAIASAFVGAVSTCLTGPVNAIISASGERRTQYAAGVLVGVLAILFGLFSPLFTRLLLAAPTAFIATLAGLAMLRVLQGAFAIAFKGSFTLGALVTFLVTVAGIPIFSIGAPFWALVAGTLVSLMLERADWREASAARG
jgi:oligopeptide/dipeptide ABC transporter ATP-binding protein